MIPDNADPMVSGDDAAVNAGDSDYSPSAPGEDGAAAPGSSINLAMPYG